MSCLEGFRCPIFAIRRPRNDPGNLAGAPALFANLARKT
jgi:hypothetical protein